MATRGRSKRASYVDPPLGRTSSRRQRHCPRQLQSSPRPRLPRASGDGRRVIPSLGYPCRLSSSACCSATCLPPPASSPITRATAGATASCRAQR